MNHSTNTFFQHVSECPQCKLTVTEYNRASAQCLPGWSLYQNALDLSENTAWRDSIKKHFEDFLLGRDMQTSEAIETLSVMTFDLRQQAYNLAHHLNDANDPSWQACFAVLDGLQEKLHRIGEKYPKSTIVNF